MTNRTLETYDKLMTCDCCNLHEDMAGKRKLFIRAINHVVSDHAREVFKLQDLEDGEGESIDSTISFPDACAVFAGRHINIITKQSWGL